MAKCEELLNVLTSLDIKYEIIDHPEVFTVEAMMPYLKDVRGLVVKNLFVKAKKKKTLWLITTKHSQNFTLNDISKKLGISGGFRFADEDILLENLGVTQGCVTPLALLNDPAKNVNFIVDSDLFSLPENEGMIYSHPIVNDKTLGMTSNDFSKFIKHTGHDPTIINFDEM